jgi:hypothetical protein
VCEHELILLANPAQVPTLGQPQASAARSVTETQIAQIQ